jgi:hypothetical protein
MPEIDPGHQPTLALGRRFGKDGAHGGLVNCSAFNAKRNDRDKITGDEGAKTGRLHDLVSGPDSVTIAHKHTQINHKLTQDCALVNEILAGSAPP